MHRTKFRLPREASAQQAPVSETFAEARLAR